MRIACIIFTISVLMVAQAAAVWQPKADRFENMDSATIRRMFKDGPFIIIKRRNSSNPPEVTTGIIIESPPSKVWKVLVDYPMRPKYIQGVSRIENLKREGNKTTFTQRNSIKFSFIKFSWDEYRIHVHYPENRIVFYDNEKPDEIIGGYELVSIDGGKATLLLYSIVADLRKMGFPVGTMAKEIKMVEELLLTSAGIMVVTGTRDYVEKNP